MEFTWLIEVSGYYQYALGNLSWLQEVSGTYLHQ